MIGIKKYILSFKRSIVFRIKLLKLSNFSEIVRANLWWKLSLALIGASLVLPYDSIVSRDLI